MKANKTLKSRRVQETARVEHKLDDKLELLIGGDLTSVSKARVIVARLDPETAARLDRVTDIQLKPPARRWSRPRTLGAAASATVNPYPSPAK